ncbi:hypothetical protein PR202_ga16871 [Eleusine coracana subsp. coracana]|uniref:Uncharacterized protein n=1 Tax=Eleusine coracana subsp. coracana TaxID=191504 RepID=A0AAV5CMS0_ELECO|nr:hypothetical protein PR202_ga16871 [Eleusine coracana subsp. coracana]
MLCWPLYSEQMFNKVLMTDLGVGLEMDATGCIKAEEVEAKVRLVMEPDCLRRAVNSGHESPRTRKRQRRHWRRVACRKQRLLSSFSMSSSKSTAECVSCDFS